METASPHFWASLSYQHHLREEVKQSISKRAKTLLMQKLAMIDTLVAALMPPSFADADLDTLAPPAPPVSIPNLSTWLAQPCDNLLPVQKPLTRAQALAQRRTAWPYFLLQVLLISLTFPLSLIALAIASWITRDTWQFWKTDGQLLIEKLSALTRRTPPMYPDAAASESSTDLSLTTHSPQQIGRRLAGAAPPSQLSPGQALAAAIIRPESVFAGAVGLPVLCSPDPVVRFVPATTDGIPDILTLTPVYELLHTAPAEYIPPDELEVMQASRPDVNLSENLLHRLTIHLFTAVPPVRAVFPDTPLNPWRPAPPLLAIMPPPVTTTQPPTPPPLTLKQRFHAQFACLFAPKVKVVVPPKDPTFDELMDKGRRTIGHGDAFIFFKQALQKAVTPQEATRALEELILDAARQLENARYESNKEVREKKRTKSLEEIHTYVNQLPDHYWLYSKAIRQDETGIREIMALLKKNRVDDAYERSKALKRTSFILYAAPHLMALRKQFLIIFNILRRPRELTKGIYTVRAGTTIAGSQDIFIAYYPELAAYFDQWTVQPFKKLTDEWYTNQKAAWNRIGKDGPSGPISYPTFPPTDTPTAQTDTTAAAPSSPRM